jgi:hypothetical protein
MRILGVLAVWWLLLTGLNTEAAAQAISPSGPLLPPQTFEIVALSPEQQGELTAWLTAVEKWQQYDTRWRNRPVHDGWAHIVERKAPPGAPAWLARRCATMANANVLDLEPRTERACRLLDDPRVASAAPIARPAAEDPPKHTSFLTRIHLDALATSSQTQSRVYGIIGTHVSLVDVGRLQLFGPPGVLLVTVPDANGGRRMTFGYTWGLSVRLADISLNSRTKNMTLFVNVSKVWLGTGETGAAERGYDIVGVSIAPRKKQ